MGFRGQEWGTHWKVNKTGATWWFWGFYQDRGGQGGWGRQQCIWHKGWGSSLGGWSGGGGNTLECHQALATSLRLCYFIWILSIAKCLETMGWRVDRGTVEGDESEVDPKGICASIDSAWPYPNWFWGVGCGCLGE